MKILYLSFLFLVIQILCPHRIDHDYLPQLIIWNVGQGQWLTYIKNNDCFHMDMGGERTPINEVLKRCKKRFNWIYISHSDNDHINFYKTFTRQVNSYCVVNPNKNFYKHVKVKTRTIPVCQSYKNSPIKTIYKPKFRNTKNKNELSKVFVIEDVVLNPGDSLKKNESYWAQKNALKNISILILGHHGSITSNSNYLINKLPNLKYSIVSARKKRYGHPHGRILLKLKANLTPILSTEHWSHISIKL